MTITIPDALPQLHEGPHEAGTGRACIMNAIAYMNGDKTISDMPSCVYPPFALMAQAINDNICKHTKCQLCESANALGLRLKHDCVTPLCGPCAHKVWMMGVQLIGTAELNDCLTWQERRNVAIQIGAALVDWDAERRALQRHDETDPNYGVSVARWGAVLTAVEGVVAGTAWPQMLPLTWPQMLPLTQISGIEGAGGRGLAGMVRLIQASADQRVSALKHLGDWYAEQHAWNGRWNFAYGKEKLMDKMPELVGILRRAAGHAEQADIILTEEDVAKVPVAVA